MFPLPSYSTRSAGTRGEGTLSPGSTFLHLNTPKDSLLRSRFFLCHATLPQRSERCVTSHETAAKETSPKIDCFFLSCWRRVTWVVAHRLSPSSWILALFTARPWQAFQHAKRWNSTRADQKRTLYCKVLCNPSVTKRYCLYCSFCLNSTKTFLNQMKKMNVGFFFITKQLSDSEHSAVHTIYS